MDRVATDVAKPPVGGADLPSFEELLAKGSFHARLARARADREKALAKAGDDGFILDTRRKPWEKQDVAGDQGGPLTRALEATVAMEAGQCVVTPLRPERRRHAVAERRDRSSAEVLLLRPSVAKLVAVPSPDASGPAPARHPRTAAATPRPVVPLRQDLPSPTSAPSPARRAFMVGSGIMAGLTLAVAATAILPYPWASFTAVPPPLAGVAPRDTAPVAASSDRAAGAGPAQPAPPITAEEAASLAALAAFSGSTSTAAAALPLAEPPDAAPSFAGPGTPPAIPGGRSAMSLPDPMPATGLADAPPVAVPVTRPDAPALVRLAVAVPADMPPGPQDLPPAAGPRFAGTVVLNAPASVGDAELAALVEGLGGEGFVLAEPNRVNMTISESNVRYFHPADAAAAEAVAAELEAEARDFTTFSPAPPAGTIEVWLAGRGDAAAPAKTRRAAGQPATSAADRELNALRNRILQQLRNGDHL